MTVIKKEQKGVYIVNDKRIDTKIPFWGKELTVEEYRALQEYRRAERGTS